MLIIKSWKNKSSTLNFYLLKPHCIIINFLSKYCPLYGFPHCCIFFFLDFDECTNYLCPPYSICNNTVGSYTCTCRAGFYQENDICKGKIVLCNICIDICIKNNCVWRALLSRSLIATLKVDKFKKQSNH